MAKLDIVGIGYRPWLHAQTHGINVRDLHLAAGIARHADVGKFLYVSRPVSLPERFVRRMPWELDSDVVLSGTDFRLYQIRGCDKLFALTMKTNAILGPTFGRRAWWNSALTSPAAARAIQASLQHLGMNPDVLLNWVPFAPDVAKVVPHRIEAFDTIDNFANHQRIRSSREQTACLGGYNHISRRASVITSVSSKAAKVFAGDAADRIHVVRNGVNRSFLTHVPTKPSELRALSGPIVGTGGNFFEKFRVDFLVELAHLMPHVQFVMLGNILVPSIGEAIRNVPNIHYFGPRPFEEAVAFYHYFDAAFILYDMEKENDGDPLKLYEFLAVGTPMISLASMGVEQRDGAVEVVDTPRTACDRLEMLIATDRDQRRRTARQFLTDQDFWDSKADKLVRLYQAALTSKGF